ncbi:P-loop containing nucleoside triphosphate hydrolase protein [Dendrothele bispora CBS 962.96]|uniref:P-loop containing nucleoside triphosphate hydrolase protein n=1 Tax=Dendrothele bispora (strain CBS 962.96) TaxID=1314807 RepID=A0A4S8MSC5_DENBC|nr:P-loop containing nucleoside triphosphate hydrolase protein [Dendrothele bispora CBS 962.96]
MAPKSKDHNSSGLGRAIINRQVKDARKKQESGMYTTDIDSTSRLKSVTQERDLEEFLNTAQLAETDFTAERRNLRVIQAGPSAVHNPYLLSEQEEKKTLRKFEENKQRLRVPRRPPWTKSMTTAELERQEKAAFLDWRRGLAALQEEEGFLLTPFERNLEVWKQLWRVIERSHLIVQIVDARNPLRFRCEDLEDYIQDVEGPEGEKGTGKGKRRSLLLINKADLLTSQQRIQWADYFDKQGVQYAFFSAVNAAALQEARRAALEVTSKQVQPSNSDEEEEEPSQESRETQETESRDQSPASESEDDGEENDMKEHSSEDDSEDDAYFSADDDAELTQDSRAKVLSVLELEDLFLKKAPDLNTFADINGTPPTRLIVGLVGYPNVGKSSTINSLLGEKKVSVSSTPGKTKHFQTIHLSESIVLCDCPGLVFPQFATTRAELVCDGVLPIDQLKEYTGPTSLVVKRIPKEVLEATYGLTIKVRGIEEGGDGRITAENFLIAYAIARGFMRSGQGNPDEARASRYVLKDYVNAKLLFCHPPPGTDETEFNKRTHEISLRRVAGKKRAPVTRVGKDANTFVSSAPLPQAVLPARGEGAKSQAVDQEFFREKSTAGGRVFVNGAHGSQEYSRSTVFPHQNIVANDGSVLQPKFARLAAVMAANPELGNGKKHKKPKRVKQRSGKGYD